MRFDGNSGQNGEIADDALRIEIRIEQSPCDRIAVQSNVGDRIEVKARELFQQPGFPDLPRSVENKRFAAQRIFPVHQTIHQEPVHTVPPAN